MHVHGIPMLVLAGSLERCWEFGEVLECVNKAGRVAAVTSAEKAKAVNEQIPSFWELKKEEGTSVKAKGERARGGKAGQRKLSLRLLRARGEMFFIKTCLKHAMSPATYFSFWGVEAKVAPSRGNLNKKSLR
eukprot:1162133-Pelagomonas_calceolata.AAC.10